MAGFVRGDVVVLPFPFSDLSQAKRRPALVLTTLPGSDLILCQITSRPTRDTSAITLGPEDFETGSLKRVSYIRPSRIFTAEQKIILYTAGRLKRAKLDEAIRTITDLLESSF